MRCFGDSAMRPYPFGTSCGIEPERWSVAGAEMASSPTWQGQWLQYVPRYSTVEWIRRV